LAVLRAKAVPYASQLLDSVVITHRLHHRLSERMCSVWTVLLHPRHQVQVTARLPVQRNVVPFPDVWNDCEVAVGRELVGNASVIPSVDLISRSGTN
jgi:hypothetical protein